MNYASASELFVLYTPTRSRRLKDEGRSLTFREVLTETTVWPYELQKKVVKPRIK